ncbi:MAG: hypothetical protein ABI175_01060, partial [Polyangiales bacterium]
MADEGDEYERRYMPGDGGVLHRAKMRAPWWFFLFFLVPIAIEIVAFGTLALTVPTFPKGLLLAPALLIPIFGMLALLFAVLRVTVSRKMVHVQYGLFGPKIPIDAIQSADVVSYDWKKYGGWGIRRGRDGSWAYNMVGDSGRAVKVVWTSPKGKTHTHLLVASDPDALAGAIARARIGDARGAASAVRLRVDDETSKNAEALIAEA